MSKFKGGYIGKILRVNLSENKITSEPLKLKTTQLVMGGRGIGSKIIFDEVAPKTDPLGDENKIVFATGPLTGTKAPSCCRFVIVTKSPLTNTITMANAGGFFGPELKFAGFDAIIIEGKAKKPSFIQIKDSEVKIAKKNNVEFIELPIAFDGISVVINPKNDWADILSVSELKKIWQAGSTVITWRNIRSDWPNRKIRLYGPGTDSGTFDTSRKPSMVNLTPAGQNIQKVKMTMFWFKEFLVIEIH